ncbi:efflux RND transporter periplasmic adaptor subunit [Stieleria varia]|uniref:Putative efflux pump membrane fusion protein n=1 Tax=Stieleria varia TaxID=2528005 RepID=A0A5C6ANX7_9BACT|nr:efflux RND transporter periplasmic adaptor subunit [Stieleria varia]TWU01207.1 putative efflux pump membrane fusion protein [Stieleria varia]
MKRFTPYLCTLCLAASLACWPAREAAAQPPAAASIAAAPVVTRQVTEDQIFVASVRPTQLVLIGSAASGRVSTCLYDEGDRVESMQPMVELLTETITSEIDAAEAEWKLRQSELEELNNGTRPLELEQFHARMLAAEARMAFTKLNRARSEQLFKQGGSSTYERDQALTADIEAQKQYAESKAAFDLADAGPRDEKIAQAKAAVDMQAAVVQKLKDQKRKHTVISRFAGYVVTKHTEVGAWVNTGDVVFEVAALDEVDVEAFVTEFQIPSIRLGMEVRLEIPALGKEFTGTVKQIIPMADPQTRTFPVRIRVKNEIIDGVPLIKAGMLAQAKLPIGMQQEARMIPKDALVFAGDRISVFVIDRKSPTDTQGTVRPVPVKLGVSQGSWIQVSGLAESDDLVVVEGNERLRPAQSVLIAETRQPDSNL